jgi:hypothetical protein
MERTRTKLKSRRKDLSDAKVRRIALTHLADDFRNPRRTGCPPWDELKLLAEKPLEAPQSTHDHVVACAKCFRVFDGFLLAMENALGEAQEN